MRPMRSLRRSATLVSMLVFAGSTFAMPAVGTENDDGTGSIMFRVTLSGAVDPTHAFGILRESLYPDDIQMICIERSLTNPVCTSTTYESTITLTVGEEVPYALLRWTDWGSAREPEEYLRGSVTVQEATQVISLGFVYPILPDTAMPSG